MWKQQAPVRRLVLFLFAMAALSLSAAAQDWVRTGTNLGVDKIRIGVADFKPATGSSETGSLKGDFDKTLFNDLNNAGIFDMVSKSFNPRGTPGSPQEIQLTNWAADPVNAAMVGFGAFSVNGSQLSVNAYLFDAKNPASPQVLGKQYTDTATAASARQIAHRFADEIIFRLGGGLQGIAETKIYYVSTRSGGKQIWVMDYDGENPRQITNEPGIALSPHVSPDNSRVVYTTLNNSGWSIRMFSLELNRSVAFQSPGGTSISPSWSADGSHVALSSSVSGDPEIYTANSTGGGLHRLTQYRGPDVSPVFNPKTDAQIAWISGRTNLPQLYVMDADGSNVQRMTDGGYATSPSWSPNGQFITFAWNRKYGPGAPGGQDIYIMDVSSKMWIQLTHGIGRCDFPSWSPDGRHIVFEADHGGGSGIYSMLADGTHIEELTHGASSSMPNWSWK